jgi:hypothetical protein
MFVATAAIGGRNTFVEFTANSDDTVDRTTYTFGSLAAGDAHPRRQIFVGTFVAPQGADVSTTQTVTINGSATTLVSGVSFLRIFRLAVPTGSTVSVEVTRGGNNMSSCNVVVWAGYDLISTTPVDTAALASVSNPVSADVDTSSGGFVIGMAVPNSGAATFTWSGLTEDVDTSPASGTAYTAASASKVSAETPRAISVTRSAGASTTIVTASFR